MYAKLVILFVAMTSSLSMATASSITPLADFQVSDGSEARFLWTFDGRFSSTSVVNVYYSDGSSPMIKFVGNTATPGPAYLGRVTLARVRDTNIIVFTVLRATSDDTGTYKIEIVFDASTTSIEFTKLTVITLDQYDEFKKASSLKINNQNTLVPCDTRAFDVASGDLTLASRVPSDYTQSTTCTLTSSGAITPCGSSCILPECIYMLYATNPGDIIELKIDIDGLDDGKSYGYTLLIEEKKTALACNKQASLLYITLMMVIVWILG